MSLGTRLVLVSATALPFLLAGCPINPSNNDGNDPGAVALRRFANSAELLGFFKDQMLAQRNSSNSWGLLDFFRGNAAVAPAADAATGGTGSQAEGGTSGGSYTTTNLQEEGVDESDVFKSDGVYFYLAKGRSLRILKANPLSELAEVGHIELEDFIDSLYLLDGKVLVIGQKFTYSGGIYGAPEIAIWPPYYSNGTTSVTAVDVTNPAAPAAVQRNEIDGTVVSSRLTSGKLILVLTVAPPLPQNPTPLAINSLTLNEVLPKMRTEASESFAVPPENWYRPDKADGYYTTAVVTLDAANVESVVGSVALVASAQTIYASPEAVYVTAARFDPTAEVSEQTAIHKFTFDAQGVAQYTASGAVNGTLLNQFSLGEHEGYLRVATHLTGWTVVTDGVGNSSSGSAGSSTDASPPTGQAIDQAIGVQASSTPKNAVYVLGENADTLEIVGKIENIAPTEGLYSARFLGTRGFLVTFRQIDPLFVLDLADPRNPQVVGQLKIPGYSDYLHPVGDNLLIGVGRATYTTQWGGTGVAGVQLSLFDVSNPAAPVAIEQLAFGGPGSSTDVSTTHKAFAFLPDRGLLAIPMSIWNYDSRYGYPTQAGFDGVVVFHVDASGFTELGRVASVIYEDWGWTQWRRPAFIGDNAYAITPAGVRGASITDFNAPASVVLTPDDSENNWYGPTYATGGREVLLAD
jgi:uncharacterized secreted protein with C-terminal beta-propeller domain